MTVDVEHPVLGTVRQAGLPFRLSATPASIRTAPPLLGEHTATVLAELGYTVRGDRGTRRRGGHLTMPKRPMITYPTQQLLGVIDDPAACPRGRGRARRDRRGGRRTSSSSRAPTAGTGLGRLGSKPNPLSRLVRAFQFLLMDQLPDFLVYERAIEDGRVVVAVHVADRDGDAPRARRCSSGSAPTSSTTSAASPPRSSRRWRGEEPAIPDALRR